MFQKNKKEKINYQKKRKLIKNVKIELMNDIFFFFFWFQKFIDFDFIKSKLQQQKGEANKKKKKLIKKDRGCHFWGSDQSNPKSIPHSLIDSLHSSWMIPTSSISFSIFILFFIFQFSIFSLQFTNEFWLKDLLWFV